MSLPIGLSALAESLLVMLVLAPLIAKLIWRIRPGLDKVSGRLFDEPVDAYSRPTVAHVVANLGLAIGSVLTLLLGFLLVIVALYELNGGGLPEEFGDAVAPLTRGWLIVATITALAVVHERRVLQRWRWRRRAGAR